MRLGRLRARLAGAGHRLAHPELEEVVRPAEDAQTNVADRAVCRGDPVVVFAVVEVRWKEVEGTERMELFSIWFLVVRGYPRMFRTVDTGWVR